jgi:hypothetical protein
LLRADWIALSAHGCGLFKTRACARQLTFVEDLLLPSPLVWDRLRDMKTHGMLLKEVFHNSCLRLLFGDQNQFGPAFPSKIVL